MEATSPNPIIFVTGGYDFCIKLWRAQSGNVIKNFIHSDSSVNCLCIGKSHKNIYAGGYQCIRSYDKDGPTYPLTIYNNFQKNVTSINSNYDERWIVSSGEDGYLRIWDIRCNKSTSLYYHFQSSQNCSIIHPNQTIIISGSSNGYLNLWDIRAGLAQQRILTKGVSINSLCINEKSNIFTCIDSKVIIYNYISTYINIYKGICHILNMTLNNNDILNESNSFTPFKCHDNYGLKCIISPNSKYLATSSADKTVKIWNFNDLTLHSILTNSKQRWVWDCAFTYDSIFMLTTSSDSFPRLWHVDKSQIIREFVGHQSAVISMDFVDVSQ